MPTLKKRSGKTTITLYAQEERQVKGTIETLKFDARNADGESSAAKIASDLEAWLKSKQPVKEKQGELIPEDKKGVAK